MLQSMLALLIGALLTLGYAPFSIWPVVPAGMIAFLILLNRSDKPKLHGWLFGLGWFSAGVGWVFVSINDFGGFPLPVSVLLMLLLAAFLALFPMLFAALLKRFEQRLWPLAAPALWALCECLRGWLFTGFPWLALGYSQIDSPLSGWLPVIGQNGVSVVLIACASVSALLLMRGAYLRTALVWAIMLLSGWCANQLSWREQTLGQANITLVQGNIAQSLRWQPETEVPTMQKYLGLTEPHWDSDVVIWPEAAVPRIEPLAQNFLFQVDEQAASSNSALITGILNYHLKGREAFNAVIVLGKQQAEDTKGQYQYDGDNRYYKHHLLPIGEFVPLESWLRKLGGLFDLPWSSFQRGDYLQHNLVANGYHFTTALCYEILFADQVRDNLSPDTDFILTLSNDAWFGHSHGPHQHLQIARVRAKEFGLPVLRATNNGLTAFINDQGAIQSEAEQFVATSLTDKVEVVRSATPYRQLGDMPMWCLTGLAFIAALAFRKLR